MNSQDQKKELLKKNALAFHRFPIPGKISVNPTKEVRDQNELGSRLYSGRSLCL